MAAGLLLSVDRALLEPAMSMLGAYVGAPSSVQEGRQPTTRAALLLSVTFEVVSHTDDSTRKPVLVMWYQQLVAELDRGPLQRQSRPAVKALGQQEGAVV